MSKVAVISPAGERFMAPESDVQALINEDGFRLESVGDIDRREDKEKYGTALGKAATVAKNVLGTGTFGLSDVALTDPAKALGLTEKIGTALADPVGAVQEYVTDPLAKKATEALGFETPDDIRTKKSAEDIAKDWESVGVTRDTGMREDLRKLDEVNPNYALAGDILGAVGTAFAGPGALLGKGATAIGAKLASKTASPLAKALVTGGVAGSIEGTAYTAGGLVTEDALGDTELTRDYVIAQLTAGALLGGGAGVGLSAAGYGMQAAGKKMMKKLARKSDDAVSVVDDAQKGAVRTGEDVAEDMASDLADDLAGFAEAGKKTSKAGPQNRLQDIAEEAAWDSLGLTGAQRASLAKKMGKSRYNAVGNRLLKLKTKDGKPLIGKVDSAENIAPKLESYLKDQGKVIGDTFERLDDAIATGESVKKVDVAKLADDIEAWTIKKYGSDSSDLGVQALKAGRKHAKRIRERLVEGGPGDMGFRESAKLRRSYGDSWRRNLEKPGKADVERYVERAIKKQTDAAIGEASEGLLGKGWKKAYKTANDDYAALVSVSEHSSKRAIQLAGNRGISLSDYMAGAAGAAGRVAQGGNLAEGGLTGLALSVFHNQVRTRGSALLARGAERAAKLSVLKKAAETTERGVMESVARYLAGSSRVGGVEVYHSKTRQPVVKVLQESFLSDSEITGTDGELAKAKIEEIDSLLTDPQGFAERVSVRTGGIERAAPKLAQGMAAKAAEIAMFLQAKAPRDPTPVAQLKPSDGGDWVPSRDQAVKFARYYRAAVNPSSVFNSLEDGVYSPEEVETLNTLYPGLMSKTREEIVKQVNSRPEATTYSQKAFLSLYFDVPLAATLRPEFTARSQQAHQPEPAQGQAGGGKSLTGIKNITVSDRSVSGSQGVEFRK